MRLARNWWMFLLRGILALVFGVVALFFPQAAFLSLVLIFGAFALVNGIFTLISAFSGGAKSENWWWLILEGIFGILIGIMTIVQPLAMATAWVLVIATWAIVTGVLEIITAIRLRKEITGEWALILGGVISVLFGLAAAVFPLSGAFAVGFLVGVYAIIFGLAFVWLGLNLRKFSKTAVN